MADELDPVLEARLRGVLREEAQSIPFTLRADTVRRVATERKRARNTQRLALMSAAAVVVLAVAGVALTLNLRNSSSVASTPSIDPAASALATYEELTLQLEADHDAKVSVTGEHVTTEPGTDPKTWDLGTINGLQGNLAASCVGTSVLAGFGDGKTFTASIEVPCTKPITLTSLVADPGTAAKAHLMVQAAPSALWRIVAGDTIPPTGTEAPSGSIGPSFSSAVFPSWDELYAFAGKQTSIVATGGVGSDQPAEDHLGPLGSSQTLEFVGACIGDVKLAFGPGDGAAPGDPFATLACNSQPLIVQLPRDASASATQELVVLTGAYGQYTGIVVDTAVASPEPSASDGTPSAAPSLPPVGKGETALADFSISASSSNHLSTKARPAGTDWYRLDYACSGEGTLTLIVDGVGGQWDCAPSGILEFTLGPGPGVEFEASMTGPGNALVRLVAYDQAKAGQTFVTPTLTVSGPDATAGDTVSVNATSGCGISYVPKSGKGGFAESCGPSWLAVASPLNQKAGSTVTFSLPSGWTITDATMSYAVNSQILPGQSPATSDGTVSHTGGTWTFTVPNAGDWGVVLFVSATHNGDKAQIPYYTRVIAQP
jgi:hypothetical protein